MEYRYDGTFPGFLTAIFDVYSRKDQPVAISPPEESTLLFTEKHEVITDVEKSERVWNGIIKTGGNKTGNQLYYAFLSCEKDVEIALLKYIQYLFSAKKCVMYDLANPDVLKINKLYRTVLGESHSALMFIRFEQVVDGTYFAPFAPKYDIIPLTLSHFKARFADQSWVIYDTFRNYGFYYDTKTIEQIVIENPNFSHKTGKLVKSAILPDEEKWQDLWRIYFRKIAISERKNLVLQRNLMPKRYWKYLTEKRR